MDGLSELRTTSWTLTQVGFEGRWPSAHFRPFLAFGCNYFLGHKSELVWDLYIVQQPSRFQTKMLGTKHPKQQNTQKNTTKQETSTRHTKRKVIICTKRCHFSHRDCQKYCTCQANQTRRGDSKVSAKQRDFCKAKRRRLHPLQLRFSTTWNR